VCNNAASVVWNKTHPEKTLAAGRRAYARDPSKAAARYAKRRANKQKATPVWLSKDDIFLMQEIYSLARLRTKTSEIVWEVDHIVPLSNSKVCGLHVPWNLQVIPLVENRKKRNILT
jgi:5-methylcytosine-specific restriction endonuclease McrA